MPAVLADPQAKKALGFWRTAGGGLSLLAFGPLCVRLGRKRAFAIMHVAAFLPVLLVSFAPANFATRSHCSVDCSSWACL